MAYHTYTENPIGVFVEKDTGNHFEYSLNENKFQGFGLPHKIWVGGEGVCGMRGWRWGTVKKTVAYIITDEDDYGRPVTEKWHLKKNTEYTT